MGQYFVIANMDKKEFIDPHRFTCKEGETGFSMKLHHICRSRMAGVLVFLLTTSNYYGLMGSWGNERILVVGDENTEYYDLYLDIIHKDEWRDISHEVAKEYFDFVSDCSA